MITLEKFFEAVEKIKVEGCWSMGLIIADSKTIDFGLLKKEMEKIKVDGLLLPPAIVKRAIIAFKNNRWIIFEIKRELPVGIYNQFKLLSVQNRIELSNGDLVRQPDGTRIVVVAPPETVKSIETKYPDFKHLFGPIISF